MVNPTPPVILIGPMGSGKTTVGKILAEQLEVSFADTDDVFVERHGVIADYFTEHGESAFRDQEEQIIADVLRRDDLGVISAGGGAVLRAANRQLIHRSEEHTSELQSRFDLVCRL